MSNHSKISVIVVTGFLGAGKTTFINFLLKKYSEKQFALVENEFGDVAIDTRLIKGIDASQMFELKEGCICCTIADEYELVLEELAKRFPDVEHLLIETTGIADPTSVIRPFFRDESLQQLYSFKGTVCLVDAPNFDSEIEKELKIKQLAVADIVLVSKSESFVICEKEILKKQIRGINPLSKIQFSEFGNPDEFKLNDLGFFPHFFPDTSHNLKIQKDILVKTLTASKPLDKENFIYWLSYFLDVHKKEIYRVKGFVCFENEAYEFVLQGVGGDFELYEGESLVSDGKSEIVFIGQLKSIDLILDL